MAADVFFPVTCQNCRWLHLRPAVVGAACFCLISLRRFLCLVALVDFLLDTKHEHLGFGGNMLFFMLKKMVPMFAKYSAANDLHIVCYPEFKSAVLSQREKMKLVPFWTAGVRSLAGVFLLQTCSGTWLGRLSHCAFSQAEAFVLWTLTFHWCIDRSMQILNESESRICCSLTITLQYTSRIKSDNITQRLTETQHYV